ncbi:MAG TPA: sigma-70 family RNA polymerase sigma factor [Candidatus Kapabacteria bacterium]|jgi:RNA polymerase sigma factor (sigma-70 family)|nr:sigma-70 family RNA polymerase sigma factor [Candidatus Kapabacteria bacterium]
MSDLQGLGSSGPREAVLSRERVAESREKVAEARRVLLRFIQSKVRDLDVAEDIVQDVFYQLVRSADASEAIEDAGAWLYRAARNRIIDWYRKHKPERMTDEIQERATFVGGPESDLDRSETWSAFVDVLAEMPSKQRDVFIMHELEGMAFSEIAELTGEKLNTLLARKHYAVKFLRKRLAYLRDA